MRVLAEVGWSTGRTTQPSRGWALAHPKRISGPTGASHWHRAGAH